MARGHCDRHGRVELVVSFGSDVDADGNLIADQCEECIMECEGATW